jgi:transcriptional regulator with AAA-type ATPase domain
MERTCTSSDEEFRSARAEGLLELQGRLPLSAKAARFRVVVVDVALARSPECGNTQTDAPTASSAGASAALGLLCVHPWLADEPVLLQRAMVVGRDAACAVSAPLETVSRQHARVDLKGALWHCADLQSRNGTYVNGRRVTDVPVGPGDVIRFGNLVTVVVRVPAEGYLGFGRIGEDLYGGATLRAALEPLQRMSRSRTHLVIEGETGSGKECVARALHDAGGRRGPYVAVNCAALPLGLAEAELFGYRRGAFTGATADHPGLLRAAHGGTLVLDEICELSHALQAKLLRALQEREVMPLGASRPVPVDLRVVALAQQPLGLLVERGEFRDDLHARLSVSLRIPPLRERIEDIPFLFDLFMRRAVARMPEVQARLIEALLLYPFPRNVRELEQLVVQQNLLVGEVPVLRRSHLPPAMLAATRRVSPRHGSAADPLVPEGLSGGEGRPVSDQDWDRLRDVLAQNGGNVVRAARELGLSRYQAYRLIRARPECSLTELREGASRAASRWD